MQLHGHRVFCRTLGEGPPVVLIHGMVNSSRHWRSVAMRLAENHRVIAPDLLGHGDSATPRGDYSLGAHATFIRDLLTRAVIDVRGQRVSARDRLYLLGHIPTLIVWGERDRTIPLAHGRMAQQAIPHSRLETLPRAAHFPHLEDPDGLARVLARFISETEPATLGDDDWAEILAPRSVLNQRTAESAPGL